MFRSIKLVLFAAVLAAMGSHDAWAQKKTVCTITVNSPDEKETLKRNLPRDDFNFVELVERGRPDWLASACRAGVRCDVLVISGHFDDGDEFYSDRVDMREHLPVDEMERVSCSGSCPGLFGELKEVYLFGCNTLNADPLNSASSEIGRSLIRSGYSAADAEQVTRVLNERHADSNRDRMRQVFANVPVIYGFSSKAPLGPTAASLLDRYFQSGANGEIGTGRASPKLLGLFAPSSMTVTAGLHDGEPQSRYRGDVCRFSDDRLSPAEKIGFVHSLLRREMAEVRMFLSHLEKYSASLQDPAAQTPAIKEAVAEIERDRDARARYLEFARDADEPATRIRMLKLAHAFGWLTPKELRVELIQTIDSRLARATIGAADVDLFCSLNKDRTLDDEGLRLHVTPTQMQKAGHAAVVGCFGSADGRARALRALASSNDEEVEIAQTYLQHRPITDPADLRTLTSAIARMNAGAAQIRALHALSRYPLSDRESLDALARLFPLAKSIGVQRAIAGVLIRSDYQSIAKPEVVRALRQYRLKSPDGEDAIDILIRRLQTSS